MPCVLCPWEPAGLPGLLERERAFLLPPGPGRCRHAIPCPETLACALELRGRPRGSAREGCAPWGERGRGASQALRDGAVCPPGCSGWLHAAWACPQVVRFSAWWSAKPCGRGVGFPAPHVCSRHDPGGLVQHAQPACLASPRRLRVQKPHGTRRGVPHCPWWPSVRSGLRRGHAGLREGGALCLCLS